MRARARIQMLAPEGGVAVNVVTLDDHLTEIDADAVADWLGIVGSRLLRLCLYSQRTIHGGYHARELHQRAVTQQLKHPPAMRSDVGIKDPRPVSFKSFQGAGLVELHQAAIADHIGGKDCGKFALHQSAGAVDWSRIAYPVAPLKFTPYFGPDIRAQTLNPPPASRLGRRGRYRRKTAFDPKRTFTSGWVNRQNRLSFIRLARKRPLALRLSQMVY